MRDKAALELSLMTFYLLFFSFGYILKKKGTTQNKTKTINDCGDPQLSPSQQLFCIPPSPSIAQQPRPVC